MGSLNKEGKSGQMAGGRHCPAPLPSPFTLVLEFSLGGLEGWALIWQLLSWEGSRACKRKLYRNTVLGANSCPVGQEVREDSSPETGNFLISGGGGVSADLPQKTALFLSTAFEAVG